MVQLQLQILIVVLFCRHIYPELRWILQVLNDQWEVYESGFTENDYQYNAKTVQNLESIQCQSLLVLRIRITLIQMDPEEPLLPRIRVPPKNKSLVYIKLKINFKKPFKSPNSFWLFTSFSIKFSEENQRSDLDPKKKFGSSSTVVRNSGLDGSYNVQHCN